MSAIIEDAKMKGLKRVTYLPIEKDPKKQNRNEVIIKNQNYESCQAYLHNNERIKTKKQNPERSQAGHLSASISATETYRHEHGLWDGQDHVGSAQGRV